MIFFSNPKKVRNIKNIKKNTLNEDHLEKILFKLSNKKIWLDSLTCSVFYKNFLRTENKIIEKIDPIYFFKSIKNNIEIQNMKRIHLIDGIALTKFLFWLKKNFRKKRISEIFAQRKLESFRKNLKDNFTGEKKKITPLAFIIKA